MRDSDGRKQRLFCVVHVIFQIQFRHILHNRRYFESASTFRSNFIHNFIFGSAFCRRNGNEAQSGGGPEKKGLEKENHFAVDGFLFP